LLHDRKINVLYIVSGSRAADLPNVPTTEELGQSEDARAILRFLATTSEVGRAIFSTPNVPAERVTILRRAFDAMARDAGFLRDAQRVGLQVDPLTGEAMEALVARVVDFPRPLVERARQERE
jgi:tripartite-type tricarboxylate transporter receptor subunit TctC